MVNKNVLSCLWKHGKEVNAVMLVWRLFHARATVTRNDRSPMVLSRVRGTIRRGQEPDSSRCRDRKGKGKGKGKNDPSKLSIYSNCVSQMTLVSIKSKATHSHRRVVREGAGATANKFNQFAGPTSCCYTHSASKIHYNIPFPDERIHIFNGMGLNPSYPSRSNPFNMLTLSMTSRLSRPQLKSWLSVWTLDASIQTITKISAVRRFLVGWKS